MHTESSGGLSRRSFLRRLGAAAAVAGVVPLLPKAPLVGTAEAAVAVPEHWWLGPDLWANRLADWALRDGRYTCIAVPGKRSLCTASVLTTRLGPGAARLAVTTSTSVTGSGFSGFLVGTGLTDNDHRRTAMVFRASGTGGGMLAVLGSDGVARFREHTDENDQLGYAEVPSLQGGPRTPLKRGTRYTLVLDVVPTDPGRVSLTLNATTPSGAVQATATLTSVDATAVRGGLALVSHAQAAKGPTYSLGDLSITGDGIQTDLSRSLGPIVGTLFSLNGAVLKMTAQVAPFAVSPGDCVTLETMAEDGTWILRTTSTVGVGYTALLRVTDWVGDRATPYRVTHSRGGDSWGGTVPAEPVPGSSLRVATINCSKAAHRNIDGRTPQNGGLAIGASLPLYSAANMYFPYEQALSNVGAQQPDVLVAMGDQYYETAPTSADTTTASPELDFFYKYLQWLWAVRDLTRDRPTLVLVDDHDVFQGNLYGEGGIGTGGGNVNRGGYAKAAEWVNLVQRVQCGHNPDPVDPAPVAQGIGVYFTRFGYGGTTFVLLEDRKFKTSADGVNGQKGAPFELLGPRQEAMLADLAGTTSGPVIVLTQTVYACVETNRYGTISGQKDSGGFPKPARDRALASIKAARAVMLSGDTHLSSLVRHRGLPGGDGPVQFTGPALASSFQRWFMPAQPLPEAGDLPHTGRATDGLGNEYTVLAVANPRVSQDDVLNNSTTQTVGDRGLKREGYGVLVVDPVARTFRFESWPDDVDPLAPGAAPYPGWPYTLSFDDA